VVVLIGLSYLAVLQAWPRFLEGFATDVCPDRSCSDALFRRYAIPVGGAALVATFLAASLCRPDPMREGWSTCSVGALAAVYASFAASPTTRPWHFVIAAIVAATSAGTIWSASRGGRLGSVAVGSLAPWPLLAFALGYPAPR
jgi:hypothetical protein